MAVTSSRRPGNGPVLVGLDRASGSGDRPDPDTPTPAAQSPLVFLRPERVMVDTEPLAVADHGRWRYLRAA
ncbi:hypothetical protein BDK92_1381 [Micromonospora pisi]|uniref:Uncharacterized protein n=1 Tax=Micromonospora pisi TaxID=589240 RepID=A0A495JEZ9_9ACTN|nr:hypothetical protein [Micromonospora pisi]RKR87108.1 hypothetical protein BDK92_1381 [Micromonospora pisi]